MKTDLGVEIGFPFDCMDALGSDSMIIQQMDKHINPK